MGHLFALHAWLNFHLLSVDSIHFFLGTQPKMPGLSSQSSLMLTTMQIRPKALCRDLPIPCGKVNSKIQTKGPLTKPQIYLLSEKNWRCFLYLLRSLLKFSALEIGTAIPKEFPKYEELLGMDMDQEQNIQDHAYLHHILVECSSPRSMYLLYGIRYGIAGPIVCFLPAGISFLALLARSSC